MPLKTRLEHSRIAIIGLGYVGLPLAVEFGKQYDTVGFDINAARIAELRQGRDSTLEVEPELLAQSARLRYADTLGEIAACNVYIVTVPTPIDAAKRPDLTPLVKASEAIGSVLKPGDTVIYESTVYPGCTEEACVPILERVSGLRYEAAEAGAAVARGDHAGATFAVGYSPERINPGDKEHRVTTIRKITSGSIPEVAEFVDNLYRRIITAGTHKASSIRVAEA
ncbi:MAG: Vi polysaccharide biosynthesis UDP-N-acetylglucosamine C-6 dehydrogenase TviB, partial [Ottowia sp.]